MTGDKPTRIFGEEIDPAAIDQFRSAMAEPFAVRGALMPDAHKGYALPIGAVVATHGVVVPAWVGYDIGCGMCALPTSCDPGEVRQRREAIFRDIYARIPTGFSHNRHPTAWDHAHLRRSAMLDAAYARNGALQLGSLGSGNHFIEIGLDETDRVWVIIHSGSRNLGHTTATHYMKLASGDGKAREGHFGLHEDSRDGRDYIDDLTFCLAFALENRREMMRRVIAILQAQCRGEGDWSALINRNHNHAEKRERWWIHRKGATHAEAGMPGVIPGNMRDGAYIVRGKGNPEALWSSSHGAGRVMGRKEAKRRLTLDGFRGAMRGITARVDNQTLDEAPDAYKDFALVMRHQESLVEVFHHVRPIINIKG